MSILIKGMEMPTRCGRCDMCVHEPDGDIDYHNACCITGADILDVGEKMEDCPLVPVPPHGRLIDADALAKMVLGSVNQEDAQGFMFTKIICQILKDVPTIIPAEGGE